MEASAGTGKTYCIVGLVLRVLLEGTASDPSRILVVTFTNAATQELLTRIRQALARAIPVLRGDVEGDASDMALRKRFGVPGAVVLEKALARVDDLGVHTIHAFCKKTLRECAFASGMTLSPSFLEDDETLLEETADDFWRRRVVPAKTLAEMAVARRWTPDVFLRTYRTWRNHPGAELAPKGGGLSGAAGKLDKALFEARASWDRPAMEKDLARITWLKNSSLSPDLHGALLDRLEAFATGKAGSGAALAAMEVFQSVESCVQKKSKVRELTHPFFASCQRVAQAAKALEDALRRAFVEEVHEAYDQEKKRKGLLAFDDLIGRLHKALLDPARGESLREAVAARYDVALIDEFQDTDARQWDIFRKVFAGKPLLVIGDPKQAIYRFRGADVFAYMGAKAQADRVYTLDKNWRSEAPMVQAVNSLFGRAARPFLYDAIPLVPVEAAREIPRLEGDGGAALQWWFLKPVPGKGKGAVKHLDKNKAYPLILDRLAREVVDLLDGTMTVGDRALGPGDLAVLVRNNVQAADVQLRLRRAGVPGVISRTGSIVDSHELDELHRIFAAIADPRDTYAVRSAMATDAWGRTAKDLLDCSDASWQAVLDKLGRWQRLWGRAGFMAAAQAFVVEEGVRPRLRGFEDGDRRLTNFLHAIEFVHRAAEEGRLSPEGLLLWISRTRARGADPGNSRDETELRLETDAEAVQISTIHKSKGLEYGVVFCPFLWEARPVKPAQPVVVHLSGGGVVYDHGSEKKERHDRLATAETLAEEARLTYVALTRARHRAYVVWGGVKQAQYSALAALLHGSAELKGSASPEAVAEKAMAQAAKSMGRWEDELRDFVGKNPKLMTFNLLEVDDAEVQWNPPKTRKVPLAARTFSMTTPERIVPWRIASFSSLSRGAAHEGADYYDPSAPDLWAETGPEGFFAFAKGARPGTCLHEILEKWDGSFGEETHNLVLGTLRRYGLDQPESHKAPIDPKAVVTTMLERLGESQFGGEAFALWDVPQEKMLREWAFTIPMGTVTPAALTSVFASGGEVQKAYAKRMGGFRWGEVRGYLSGFVDLVFCHNDRWTVVDWKSNHLGNRVSDYSRAPLQSAMVENHYVLQYHLYLLALHRYLRSRLADYDYDRHIAGACYVFLRGLDGSAEHGWFRDQPTREFIEALDALFEEAS
jgi:exodeoxyribonuclease V beta subunit